MRNISPLKYYIVQQLKYTNTSRAISRITHTHTSLRTNLFYNAARPETQM